MSFATQPLHKVDALERAKLVPRACAAMGNSNSRKRQASPNHEAQGLWNYACVGGHHQGVVDRNTQELIVRKPAVPIATNTGDQIRGCKGP